MTNWRIWIASFILFLCPFLNSCKEQKQSYQTTGYVESHLFFVKSPLGGQLKKLSVHEGESLSKGEQILTLEDQKSLKAPTTSIVNELFYQVNEYVPPNSPIVSLVIPSQMRIIFYVPESNLEKIKLRKKVLVLVNNKKYPVKITFIANQAEYTPDALFSEKNSYKLVYKIKANVTSSQLRDLLKIGQPVAVDYE